MPVSSRNAPVGADERAARVGWPLFAAVAFAAAGSFVWFELLESLRAGHLYLFADARWFGLAAAVALYGLALAAPAAGLSKALALLLRDRRSHATGLAPAVLLTSIGLWLILRASSESPPLGSTTLPLLLLLPFPLMLALGASSRLPRPGVCAAIWGIACLSASSVACLGADAFMYRRGGDFGGVWLSVLTLTVVAAIAYALRALAGAGRLTVRAAWLATLFIAVMPPAVVRIAPRIFAEPVESTAIRHNLLFITCDALRADYCSVYGGQVATPHLERVAEQGVLFEDCYALAPWTLPSFKAMFASAYPASLNPDGGFMEHGMRVQHYMFMNPDRRMLAGQLTARGYRTAALLGNELLNEPEHILRGFQRQFVVAPYDEEPRDFLCLTPMLSRLAGRVSPRLRGLRPVDSSRMLAHRARVFLEQHVDSPFFLWVHFMDPHDPYNPPDRFREYSGGPAPWFSRPENATILTTGAADFHHLSQEERDHARMLYEGEIRYVDASIGSVLNTLERLGIQDTTVVCITSDHGEELWDRGQWGHGHSLYQDQLRVPLIFRSPLMRPRRVTTPVSQLDLMPTLAELTGVPILDHWRGESLIPILHRGQLPTEPKPCFSQATTGAAPEPLQAVVLGRIKGIRGLRDRPLELYDLDADSGEEHDRASYDPDTARALGKLLDEWSASFDAVFDLITEPGEAPADLDELQRRMEALGYL